MRPARSLTACAEVLSSIGVGVTVFHDDTSTSQSRKSDTIVRSHNSAGPHDLDVSVHFNAYDSESPRLRSALCQLGRREICQENRGCDL